MSDGFHDLKQAIRSTVHTCVINYWERQRKLVIERDDGLAHAIADYVRHFHLGVTGGDNPVFLSAIYFCHCCSPIDKV